MDPESLIDVDDLNDEDLLVACSENKKEKKFFMYIWKGQAVQLDQEETKSYLKEVKSNFFSPGDLPSVISFDETPYSESDEFMNML